MGIRLSLPPLTGHAPVAVSIPPGSIYTSDNSCRRRFRPSLSRPPCPTRHGRVPACVGNQSSGPENGGPAGHRLQQAEAALREALKETDLLQRKLARQKSSREQEAGALQARRTQSTSVSLHILQAVQRGSVLQARLLVGLVTVACSQSVQYLCPGYTHFSLQDVGPQTQVNVAFLPHI